MLVSANAGAFGDIDFNIYLGDVKQEVLSLTSAEPLIIVQETFSYNITAETNNGFFMEGIANTGGSVTLELVSVKEIITVNEYEFIAKINKNGVAIREYETVFKAKQLNPLIKFIEKIVRFLS